MNNKMSVMYMIPSHMEKLYLCSLVLVESFCSSCLCKMYMVLWKMLDDIKWGFFIFKYLVFYYDMYSLTMTQTNIFSLFWYIFIYISLMHACNTISVLLKIHVNHIPSTWRKRKEVSELVKMSRRDGEPGVLLSLG